MLVIYTLSGVTALAYEVLWVRMLSLQFGVSIFGAVVTVTAFMAGLGVGSLAGLRVMRSLRPLRVLAAIEAAIALYALCLPALSGFMNGFLDHAASATNIYQWYALQFTAALGMLFLPALLMGLGFPVVLRACRGLSVSIGCVYGLNTLGGALGALLPLWLLPVIGWSSSVRAVAALGLLAALGALALSFIVPPATAEAAPQRSSRPALGALLAYAGIGMAALALEITWTRLFGMVLLRTEYVLAVILAVFLVGVAAGSLLVRRGLQRYWLSAFPVLAALFSLISLWALPLISQWAEQAQFGSLTGALVWQGAVIALVTLPVTLVLGAWLPLLAHTLGDEPAGHGPWLYGANALGGAVGALGTGLIMIPWLGSAGTLCVAALMLFACGMVWAAGRWLWLALAGLVLLAVPVRHLPPVATLLPQAHGGSRDLYVHEDAVSITHVVQQRDGQRVLLTDLQRMDASTAPSAVAVQEDQARLALLLHPDPRSVLFLGLGTGISAAGSLAFPAVRDRTAVELSRGSIVSADRWFSRINHHISRKTRVVWDDARHYLEAGRKAYDVIIGDVFHPDLVGRSALLSVQQFRRVRARLAPGGLYVQWLALNQFDPQSLQVVMRTFQRVFPDAVGFIDGFRFALVGPNGRFDPDGAVLGRMRRLDEAGRRGVTGGEGPWTWLGRYWGRLDTPPGRVQGEWAPYIEFRLPKARYQGDLNTVSVLVYLLRHRPGLKEAQAALNVAQGDTEAFERGYLATELGTRSWLASLRGREGQAQRLLRLAYDGNPRDRWISFSLADQMFATLSQARAHGLDRRHALETILNIRPDHVGALRALWRLERQAGHPERARAYLDRIRKISPLARVGAPARAGQGEEGGQ